MDDENFIFTILTIVGLGVLVVFGALYLDSASCKSKGTKMSKTVDWGVLSGCMIEYEPDKWVSINQYRVNN